MVSVGVVIPAAGLGKRMKSRVSKQFLELEGKPILLHTLEVFETHPEIDQIVVVTQQSEIERTRKLIEEEGIKKVSSVIEGGKERQESVFKGLYSLHTEWVLVHDAVRPFVSSQVISCLIETVRRDFAVIPAVRVKDTIKVVKESGVVESTPNRKDLWMVQTPQAFQLRLLQEAHQKAWEKGFVATDDSMLVEQLGVEVRIVIGDYTNIKLTTPEDWNLAQTILEMRRKQNESWTRL